MDASPRRYIEDPRAMCLPWVESPFFEQLLESSGLGAADRQLARTFHDDGYVVIEDAVPPALADAVTADYARLFDPEARFPGAPRELVELLRRDPSRKQDAWYVSRPVREVACLDRVIEVLRMLYGREPVPFQTLNFVRGTEQKLHSDAMHFSSIPAGFMCGVWVALEDIGPGSGPLRYVPGSHRFSEVRLEALGLWAEVAGKTLGASYAEYERYLEELVRVLDLPVEELVVPKGAALVWAANLLHGGSPILDPASTRRSQVTHYYFQDCVHYTPIYSNTALGQLYVREVYDIRRGVRLRPRLNGVDLRATPLGGGVVRLALPR